jgi:hypothetical protein
MILITQRILCALENAGVMASRTENPFPSVPFHTPRFRNTNEFIGIEIWKSGIKCKFVLQRVSSEEFVDSFLFRTIWFHQAKLPFIVPISSHCPTSTWLYAQSICPSLLLLRTSRVIFISFPHFSSPSFLHWGMIRSAQGTLNLGVNTKDECFASWTSRAVHRTCSVWTTWRCTAIWARLATAWSDKTCGDNDNIWRSDGLLFFDPFGTPHFHQTGIKCTVPDGNHFTFYSQEADW